MFTFQEVPRNPLHFIKEGKVSFNPAQANFVFNVCRYDFNRNERQAQSHIATLAKLMRDGAWRPWDAIDFARTPDGKLTLVNGHHRMLAQAEAGVNVGWTITIHDVSCENEKRQLFWSFDTVLRKRTMSNVLNAVDASTTLGVSKTLATKMPSACKFIEEGMRAARNGHGSVYTPQDLLRLSHIWNTEAAEFEALTEKASRIDKRKLLSTQILAVGLVTLRHSPTEAREFWSTLAEDDGLRKHDPRKTLLDWVRNSHLSSSSMTLAAAAAVRGWNAFYEGRTISSIRPGDKEIVILGTNGKYSVTA